MTSEYYQVEESSDGGNFWPMYNDTLTLEVAMARLSRQRRKELKRAQHSATGHVVWRYRLVKVVETREVVETEEG